MFIKTELALAAALILGAASAVQAGDHENDRGGFRVGPMGQHFQGANPGFHRSMRYWDGVYAYAPDYRVPSRTWRRDWR